MIPEDKKVLPETITPSDLKNATWAIIFAILSATEAVNAFLGTDTFARIMSWIVFVGAGYVVWHFMNRIGKR